MAETIEEMVRTASVEFRNCTMPGGCAVCLTAAIDAVLDKHVRALLANAHEDGIRAGRGDVMMSNHNDYADRILSHLKDKTNG